MSNYKDTGGKSDESTSDDKCLIPFKPIAVSKFNSVVLKTNLVMKEN